ncbi:hypothetical protein ACFVXH_23630 [Kitasatospora sp. NPDC058184]|uniref:hypothetical protein n=1 Tax=Kitasatospora sp. NPDC058184 TaxID=3346370 RepID=UPI0036DDAE21
MLFGSPQAAHCVRYVTEHLAKSVAECHTPAGKSDTDHVDRLATELRYEPCSPTSPLATRLLHAIPERFHWRQALDKALARTEGPNSSATIVTPERKAM